MSKDDQEGRTVGVDSSDLLSKINVVFAKKSAHLRKQCNETHDYHHAMKCKHKKEGIEWAFDKIESILNS